MKNFAMLGKWHVHAEEYANFINRLPGCKITKVWDPDEITATEWAQSLQCSSASFEDIMSDKTIEGVVVCTATNEHPDVIIAACNAGKAVFTEKVLTLTVDDGMRVLNAVKANNTRFAISFPQLTFSMNRFALETAKSGKLGQINYARVRNVHNGSIANWLPPHFYDGKACGGGAMIDLGAHPMYLLNALLGLPEKVSSTFTCVTKRAVEDNAVSVLEYKDGAIAVSETGFVSTHYPYTIEIGGTEGTLIVRGNQVSYCCPETNNKWKTPDTLPSAMPLPLETWALSDKSEDIPEAFNIDAALDLTKVMAMSYGR